MSDSPDDARQHFTRIATTLCKEPGVSLGEPGKRFGAGTLQVGGRIFAMLTSRVEFVVKLPPARVAELEERGVGQRFDPGHGRLMKAWLAVDSAADVDWLALAREALRYLSAEN